MLEEMEKEGEHQWINKNGEKMNLEGQKYKLVKKGETKIKILDSKTIEWDGDGEMPEEIKKMVEEGDGRLHVQQGKIIDVDINADENGKKLIKIKKDNSGQEKLIEFELEGDKISEDVQKILDENGLDLKFSNRGEGEEKFIMISEKLNDMDFEIDGVSSDIQKVLKENNIDWNDLTSEGGQKKIIKIKTNDGEEDEITEYELEGDEIPEDIQKILDENGIDLDELKADTGDKSVKKVIKIRKEERSSKKGQLGVLIENHPDGILVTEVMEDSGAEDAGLLKGDIITSVNDVKVTTLQGLVEEIKSFTANEVVKIDFIRNNENHSKEVVLKERKSAFEFETWEDVMNKGKVKKEIRIEKEIIKEK